MNRVGVVILSRFSSNRLPGKALIKIKNKPILKYILERIEQVIPRERIVIATSNEKSDDKIVSFAKKEGVNFYRGSLENVANRFFQAGNEMRWQYAVRINGDNIFVDVNLLRDLISLVENTHYNFVSNVKERTYPKGMSIEVIHLGHYKTILNKLTDSAKYREHVTLYMYENEKEDYLYIYNKEIPEARGMQMALDTNEDLKRTKKIIACFKKPHWEYNLKELFEIWNKLIYEKYI